MDDISILNIGDTVSTPFGKGVVKQYFIGTGASLVTLQQTNNLSEIMKHLHDACSGFVFTKDEVARWK